MTTQAELSVAALLAEPLTDAKQIAAFEAASVAFAYGAALRGTRLEADLTQADCARLAGTSQPAIARLEIGGVDPKLSTVWRHLRALGKRMILGVDAAGGIAL